MPAKRSPGRPSLSGTGDSPQLRIRLGKELMGQIREQAAVCGVSVSEYVRLALRSELQCEYIVAQVAAGETSLIEISE